MGLHLYTGVSSNFSDGEDSDGMKAYAFELLRELSDVAYADVFAEGSEEALSLKIPQDDLRRIHAQILENVPLNRLNSFGMAINAYEDDARAAKMRMNGHARPIEKHVLDISIHLATTLKTLLRAAATGDDLLQKDDGFDERDAALLELDDEKEEYDPELHEGWSDNGGGGEIVAGEDDEDENEESAPWKQAADHWKPENERDDEEDDGDWSEKPLFSQTPDSLVIDPETEALILAEASEMIVDMEMLINEFLEAQAQIAQMHKDARTDSVTKAYHDTIVDVMRGISARMGGKTNLECLGIELESDDVMSMIEHLDDLQRVGCISSIFHNVAETALNQVEMFSNMVDAIGASDDPENDPSLLLTLTFIERLRERHGLSS